MTTFEKIGLAIVGVAMATTLTLPGRQTPKVIAAAFKGLSQWTGVSMGTIKKV